MNNVFKSQWYLYKKQIASAIIFFIAVLAVFWFGSQKVDNTIQIDFTKGGLYALVGIAIIPVLIISFYYFEHLNIYETRIGYGPSQILLGRAIVFVLPTIIISCLLTLIVFIFNHNTEWLIKMGLYTVLALRMVLCIVFLSPLFREGSLMPTMSIIVLFIQQPKEIVVENFINSPLSYLGFVQCVLLNGAVDVNLASKVLISTVVASIIYFIVGCIAARKITH